MKKSLLKDLKLLIVEDESKLSRLLKDALHDYFYSVTTAVDGLDGIEKFKKVHPDIVITDIMMPNCDGLEMCTKLKEINDKIPIIVLSAFSEKEKLLKAIDLGINKYFIKPFDPDEVLEHLEVLASKMEKKRVIKLQDGFSFDNNTRTLYKGKTTINITKREKEFLSLLLQTPNIAVSQETIKLSLWQDKDSSDEKLRTFIKRFRVKTSKTLIENVSAQGYLISPVNG